MVMYKTKVYMVCSVLAINSYMQPALHGVHQVLQVLQVLYKSSNLVIQSLGNFFSELLGVGTPSAAPYKKDGDRSKGKGRRVSLGGRICSIPCCTSCAVFCGQTE